MKINETIEDFYDHYLGETHSLFNDEDFVLAQLDHFEAVARRTNYGRSADWGFLYPPAALSLSCTLVYFDKYFRDFLKISGKHLLPAAYRPSTVDSPNLYVRLFDLSLRFKLDPPNKYECESKGKNPLVDEARKISVDTVEKQLLQIINSIQKSYDVYRGGIRWSNKMQSVFNCHLEQYWVDNREALMQYQKDIQCYDQPLEKVVESFAGVKIVREYREKPDIFKLVLQWRGKREYCAHDLFPLFDYICKFELVKQLPHQRQAPTINNFHDNAHYTEVNGDQYNHK